jgi:hypothetical protein
VNVKRYLKRVIEAEITQVERNLHTDGAARLPVKEQLTLYLPPAPKNEPLS